MSQKNRIAGGLINRQDTRSFRFNGQNYSGYDGDTLASALIANDVTLVGRSFKYHRPRGIFTAGSEEPNALVQLREGIYQEPNTRATTVELFDGLTATSQNHRGPLKYDLMSVNDLFSRFLSAGFYYKTFMWPKAFWEKFYEPAIRASAGLGALSLKEDPDAYDKGFLHCDLLVIGGGAAGLSAARDAGRSGARVILADEDFILGGRLNAETHQVDEIAGSQWAANLADELVAMPNVRVMTRTTVSGAWDHGVYGALERKTDHQASSDGKPRQVFWRIYTKAALLCAGATERSIAFGNNDRPGVMLAGSVRAYTNRFAAAPGQNIAIFTNNDDGWQTARDLQASGVQVAAVIDSRNGQPQAELADVPIIMGGQVANVTGRHRVRSITLTNGQVISCDSLAVSGGWSPNVHLTCHQRGRPTWNDEIAAFVPGHGIPQGMVVAGAANGTMTLASVIADAQTKTNDILSGLGFKAKKADAPQCSDEPSKIEAFWHVGASPNRAFVDLQNDVTTKDIKQSHQEGFRAVEHLKRYTTLGMATDQGKTANVLGLAIMAECSNKSIPETGTTIFRPPYSPVAMGAMAGRTRGKHYRPTRKTPSHKWASEQGAVFVESGMWLRAQWYPLEGESHWRESVDREVINTRTNVGVCDVTTLGKIDIQGNDAAAFLNNVYANAFGKLPVGKVRYGLMLREDGMVMDDGTTARMSENHFVMTTTTANAVGVYRHLEFCKQCLWPDMDVHLISTTEQWAQFAVAGPKSRRLLQKLVDPKHDISNEAFGFMACAEISICGGVPARLFRISFSGELAYEIAVPTRYGNALMERLNEAGQEFGIMPYGLEALNVMRIEKGHPTGNELVGTTTAAHLGLGKMQSKKKDCIGNIMSERQAFNQPDDIRLVGFKPLNPNDELKAGAHFVAKGQMATLENDQGWLSSVCYSPNLGHHIGIGFIKNGQDRIGEVVVAADPLRDRSTDVEIVSPHFVDPEGDRLRG